ncbi:MAG TPA: endonuclease V [Jiangellaceae bacterium]|nr:endonuclease V [Jiangellaceae bacterium]
MARLAAVVMRGGVVLDREIRRGVADAPYSPGLLALRMGRPMDATVGRWRRHRMCCCSTRPAATIRGEPGWRCISVRNSACTVGITRRPLLAQGEWEDRRGHISPLRLGDIVVACWVRTRPGVGPLVVHPGWRVDHPRGGEFSADPMSRLACVAAV